MSETTRLLRDVYAVDPRAGLAGVATIAVEGGAIASLAWRDGAAAAAARWRDGAQPLADDPGLLLLPALVDLHAHFRQPGATASEDAASGSRAAAHGGYGTVCLMANTEPAIDRPERLAAAIALQGAVAGGSPAVRLLPIGAATVDHGGSVVAPLARLAAAGAVAFSDDGSPIADRAVFLEALLAAAGAGRPLIEHCEAPELSAGGEAADGLVATRLGLRPWRAVAEVEAVERAIGALREAVAQHPAARLHLTHLSTAAGIDLVRRARTEGLPASCDVTPHHIALTDRWLAGDRHWSWEVDDGDPLAVDDGSAYATSLRVCPPLRSASDAAACRAALRDGTAVAIATDHAPHSRERKEVEFGLAANGIAGIETSLSVALAAHAAGEISLARLAAALTTGPADLLGLAEIVPGFAVGAPADLVLVDRTAAWVPGRDTLAGRSINTPLVGRLLPGVVRLTLHGGAVAWEG